MQSEGTGGLARCVTDPISKWKQGEHMSSDMEEKLRAIINIGDKSPSFVLSAGSLEAANKWEKLIQFLAEAARDSAETNIYMDELLRGMRIIHQVLTNRSFVCIDVELELLRMTLSS